MLSKDDVVRIAHKAGIRVIEGDSFADDVYISILFRFANLVAAQERDACMSLTKMSDEHVENCIRAAVEVEREECAKLCEDAASHTWKRRKPDSICNSLAALIRARGIKQLKTERNSHESDAAL